MVTDDAGGRTIGPQPFIESNKQSYGWMIYIKMYTKKEYRVVYVERMS